MEIHEVITDLIRDLDDREEEFREAHLTTQDHLDDLLCEAVDSAVPIYYYDLANVLASDCNLAYIDDPGLLGEDPSVYDMIKVAIYERLTGEASDWREKKEPEWEDWLEAKEAAEEAEEVADA